MRLRLYVTDANGRSLAAVSRMRSFVGELPGGPHDLEVLDVLERRGQADDDGVLATPTLIRLAPAPRLRIVGDMTHDAVRRKLCEDLPEP